MHNEPSEPTYTDVRKDVAGRIQAKFADVHIVEFEYASGSMLAFYNEHYGFTLNYNVYLATEDAAVAVGTPAAGMHIDVTSLSDLITRIRVSLEVLMPTGHEVLLVEYDSDEDAELADEPGDVTWLDIGASKYFALLRAWLKIIEP